jgi:hypothetical protein
MSPRTGVIALFASEGAGQETDIFELVPSESLTENEIAAAKLAEYGELITQARSDQLNNLVAALDEDARAVEGAVERGDARRLRLLAQTLREMAGR